MGEVRTLSPADVVAMLAEPAGAYVHIPFCARICPFCPYNKVIPAGDQPERYFVALRTEIERYLDAGAGGPDGFTSLYVGGGTPTLFPEPLSELVALLPVRGERAIEVLPTHASPGRLADLQAMGFTAVSIGVQSFSDEVLRHLRRPHDAAAARGAVQAAVGRFPLVDVDLIVDVEFDDLQAGAFLRDLVACFELGADQVSTYPLMRFGYTPFGRARHSRRREHEVLAAATELAARHGYERRSVWTFNRPGSVSYSSITRRRYLGFGAGSSSFLGRDFLVNHFGVETYASAVRTGALPVARWLHLGATGGAFYDAFWQAYAGSIDLPSLRAAYGPRAVTALGGLVRAGIATGMLSVSSEPGCALTARGFDRYHDVERWVTYHLIEPLWAQMLDEHVREGGRAAWAAPGSGRHGLLWPTVTRRFERRLASAGDVPAPAAPRGHR